MLNENERENEMTFDHFDTEISPEETSEYSDYVDAVELEAIEAELAELEDEFDDINLEDYELDDKNIFSNSKLKITEDFKHFTAEILEKTS